MSSTCRGCGSLRSKVGHPGYPSCKKQRLCKLLDRSIVDRHPGQSLDQLVAIHKVTALGAQTAARYVTQLGSYPESGIQFCDLLIDLHHRIFGDAEPEIAGRFRRDQELVRFGNEGRYERFGTDPPNIQTELHALFVNMPAARDHASLELRNLCLRLASFFERFFMIHPFVDGNGRVARLVAELIARRTGRWRWDQRAPSTKSRNKYVDALEHAHKHTPVNGDDRCDNHRGDALIPLARWINSGLITVVEDDAAIDEGKAPGTS